jgi:SAM-dependent methyltransferase
MGYGGNCFLGDPDSIDLWTEIIDKIPDEVFLNPDIKILNVACGYGTESMVIVRRMRKLGFEDDYINNRIYVLDKAIWATNRMMLRGRFKNVIRADFLTWETDMKFDIVVGNPPYNRSRKVRNIGAPLWVNFLDKSNDVVADNGHMLFIIPATWMNRSERGAWKYIQPNDLVYVNPDVKKHFPGVGGNGGTFSAIHLIKRKYSGITSIRGEFDVNFHVDDIPANNKQFSEESIEFLKKCENHRMTVNWFAGSTEPSINSHHWSKEKTDTHIFETFYSGASDRRSLWCDQSIGHHGQLKLVIPASGNLYNNMEITNKGVGRQANYVLGTERELSEIRSLIMSENNLKFVTLRSEGNYINPLKNITVL